MGLRPHTHVTFSCVFVLFQVMSWLFSIPLRTVNNTKMQENVSLCTGPNFGHKYSRHLIVLGHECSRHFIVLGHKYGRHFIILGHKYGCCDVR